MEILLGDSFAIPKGSIEKDILINVVDSPKCETDTAQHTYLHLPRPDISLYI